MGGKVKAFFDEKGYGFIVLDEDSSEIFFHASALQDTTRTSKNAIVECSVTQGQNGKQRATKVIVLQAAPALRPLCTNPLCVSKTDRHFEDKCPLAAASASRMRLPSSTSKPPCPTKRVSSTFRASQQTPLERAAPKTEPSVKLAWKQPGSAVEQS